MEKNRAIFLGIKWVFFLSFIGLAFVNFPIFARGPLISPAPSANLVLFGLRNSTTVFGSGNLTFSTIGVVSVGHPAFATASFYFNPKFKESANVMVIRVFPRNSYAYNAHPIQHLDVLPFKMQVAIKMFLALSLFNVHRFWINSTEQYEQGNITLTKNNEGVWTGSSSIEWFNAGNWSCEVVLLNFSNKTIASVPIKDNLVQVFDQTALFNVDYDFYLISVEFLVAAFIVLELPPHYFRHLLSG